MYQELGPTGKAAAWTFLAVMLGSLVSTLGVDRFVTWIVSRGADWDTHINDALQEARIYEEHNAYENPHSVGFGASNKSRVPSRSWGEHLAEVAHDRVRKRADVRFRAQLSLALLLPAGAAIARGSCLWLLALIPSALLLFELTMLQFPLALQMFHEHEVTVDKRIAMATNQVAELEGQVGTGGAARRDELVTRKAGLAALNAERAKLKEPTRRGIWALWRRSDRTIPS